MNYDSMTVAQLKALADKHGVTYTSKVRKIDLIRAIDDALTVVVGTGSMAGRTSLEEQGWVPIGVAADGSDVHIAPLGTEAPYANVSQAELRVASWLHEEQAKRDRINRKRNRQTTERKIIRQLRASGSKYPGVGGRAMGAKHYVSRSNPVPADLRLAIVGRGLTGAYGR